MAEDVPGLRGYSRRLGSRDSSGTPGLAGMGGPQREQGVLTGRKTPTTAALLCAQITESPRTSFKCTFRSSGSDTVALGLGKSFCISKNSQVLLLLLFHRPHVGEQD